VEWQAKACSLARGTLPRPVVLWSAPLRCIKTNAANKSRLHRRQSWLNSTVAAFLRKNPLDPQAVYLLTLASVCQITQRRSMHMNCGMAIALACVETRTIHKLRIRIIPFLFLLYFVTYLDRINICFAALTMNKSGQKRSYFY
jgi:hypothetical protein